MSARLAPCRMSVHPVLRRGAVWPAGSRSPRRASARPAGPTSRPPICAGRCPFPVRIRPTSARRWNCRAASSAASCFPRRSTVRAAEWRSRRRTCARPCRSRTPARRLSPCRSAVRTAGSCCLRLTTALSVERTSRRRTSAPTARPENETAGATCRRSARRDLPLRAWHQGCVSPSCGAGVGRGAVVGCAPASSINCCRSKRKGLLLGMMIRRT